MGRKERVSARNQQLSLTEAPLWAVGRAKVTAEMARRAVECHRWSEAERLYQELQDALDGAQREIAAWDAYQYRRR